MFSNLLQKIDISRLFVYSLVLTASCIPLYKTILPQLIALNIILCIACPSFLSGLVGAFRRKPFLVLLMFYLLHVFSLLYTNNLSSGLFDLEVKLSLLIFPLIIYSSRALVYRHWKLILKGFVLGNVIAITICFFYFIQKNMGGRINILFDNSLWENKDILLNYLILGKQLFNNSAISIFHNPVYFSIYLVFAVSIVYLYVKNNIETVCFYEKISAVLFVLVSIIMLLVLQSRAAWLSLFVLFVIEIYRILRFSQLKLHYKFVSVFVLLLSLSVMMIRVIPILKNEKYYKTSYGYEAIELRKGTWSSAFKVFANNLIIGVGSGDLVDKLVKEYSSKGLQRHQNKRYNAHNQYLETLAGLGLLGGAILIYILYFLFKRNKDEGIYSQLSSALGIIIIIAFTFESMLNTLAGVSFVAFFYSILVIPLPESNNKLI